MIPAILIPANGAEAEILERVRRGDREAVSELYLRWGRAIHQFALHMSGRAEVADDVTQEVFLVLLRGVGRFDLGRGPLVNFLFGVARRQLRRAKRLGQHWELSVTPEFGEADPALDVERQREVRRLQAAVAGLPIRYREAVVICDLQEMSYEEAAAALGCALGTVRSRLHRGRKLLAERMRSTQ